MSEADKIFERLLDDIEKARRELLDHFKCVKPLERLLEKLAESIAGVKISIEFMPYWMFGSKATFIADDNTVKIYTPTIEGLVDLLMSVLHESRHKMQFMRLGIKFDSEYTKALTIYGYEHNPFQVDAENYARDNLATAYRWVVEMIGRRNAGILEEALLCLRDVTYEKERLVGIEAVLIDAYHSGLYSIDDVKPDLENIIKDYHGLTQKMIECCRKLSEALKTTGQGRQRAHPLQ